MGRCSPDYARWSREDTPEALTGWERRQASETSPAHFSSFTLRAKGRRPLDAALCFC